MKKTNNHFCMLFINNMSDINKIKYIDDLKLLLKFSELSGWNSGKVLITTSIRQQICKHLEIHPSNLSRSIKRLKNLDLVSGDKGTYMINPKLIWKGDIPTRDFLVRDKIEIEL